MSPIFLNLLWLVPIATWLATRNKTQIIKSTARGFSLGLVISPASLGLYTLYFVNPITALLGIVGLVIISIHSSVGYPVAVALDIIPAQVLAGTDRIIVEVINAVFWSLIYGFVGYLIGYYKIKHKKL